MDVRLLMAYASGLRQWSRAPYKGFQHPCVFFAQSSAAPLPVTWANLAYHESTSCTTGCPPTYGQFGVRYLSLPWHAFFLRGLAIRAASISNPFMCEYIEPKCILCSVPYTFPLVHRGWWFLFLYSSLYCMLL